MSAGEIGRTLCTVGHSTRGEVEFVALLQAHGVHLLVDVRTVPRSRRNPQFEQTALAAALPRHDIRYLHLPALGGLRRPHPDSPNTGWRNESFRGYADYMATAEFAAALDELLSLAAETATAIMCAEAVPWRCHRSLLADAATARGVGVEHLMSATVRSPHRMTPFARVQDGRITYPG